MSRSLIQRTVAPAMAAANRENGRKPAAADGAFPTVGLCQSKEPTVRKTLTVAARSARWPELKATDSAGEEDSEKIAK